MRVRDWLMPVSPVVLLGLLACGPGALSQDASATGAEIPPAGHASSASAPLTVAPLLPVAGSSPVMSAAAGTEAAPLRTVAKALSLLQPGEAIFLKSGTYTERLKLDAQDGSADHYLTIKAAPNAKPVFKGGSGSRTPLLDVRRAYWRIEGLTFDAAGDRAFVAFWRGEGAHHGILRACTLKNGTEGAGVYVAEKAHDVLVEGNSISNFWRSGDVDSHGVCVETNSRNVTVRANDIFHNSGDGVQCLGPEGGATEPGTPFDNLLIEDNDLHDNRENGADIKTCTRVTLRGNRVWGHHLSATSGGEGVVVHMSARDVTLEDNELYGNGRGIQIGGGEGAPPARIVLTRNRVFNGYNADGSEGSGIRVDAATDVKVTQNTVWNMPTYGLVVGQGESGASESVQVRNNIIGACAKAVVRLGSTWKSLSLDGNLYSQTTGAASFRREPNYLSLASWRSSTGWDAHSLEKPPAFVDLTSGDFWLAPASPARDAGQSTNGTWCGRAPDIGARESDCP